MTPKSSIIESYGVEPTGSCPHSYKKWNRIGDSLYNVCKACGKIVARDTAAVNLPATVSLANQTDPAEARAWRGEDSH